MTCGNPIKHNFKNAFIALIEAISFERKLSDD